MYILNQNFCLGDSPSVILYLGSQVEPEVTNLANTELHHEGNLSRQADLHLGGESGSLGGTQLVRQLQSYSLICFHLGKEVQISAGKLLFNHLGYFDADTFFLVLQYSQ